MELLYRNATMADTGQLQRLGLNAYGQFRADLTEENWKRFLVYLSAENTYPDLLKKSTCFVCELNDEIIGMAYLIPHGNPTDIFPSDWCYVRMIGVHVRHEGKGIGKALTKLCVNQAKASGENIIGLHTSEFMDAARHIYESLGFEKVKELEPRFGKKYWLYKLDL